MESARSVTTSSPPMISPLGDRISPISRVEIWISSPAKAAVCMCSVGGLRSGWAIQCTPVRAR